MTDAENKSITQDFLHAAERNDAPAALACLRDGARVNASDRHGVTALSWAARHGNTAFAEKLVAAGAEPECRDDRYFTPLLTSISVRQEETALAFIRMKFNVAAAGGLMETALTLAAEWGNAPVVAALIAAGADVDGQDGHCALPLTLAARNGNAEAAGLLLDGGADVNKRDGEGRTALIHAVANNRQDMVAELLRRGADISICDHRGRGPAEAAFGNAELTAMLKSSFADYDLPLVKEGLRKPVQAMPALKLRHAQPGGRA